jgi:hypothetical protein
MSALDNYLARSGMDSPYASKPTSNPSDAGMPAQTDTATLQKYLAMKANSQAAQGLTDEEDEAQA